MTGPSSEFFSRRGILTHYAPSYGLARARRIITRLEAGTPYWKLHGKRLHWNRSVISIPVGRSWRSLAKEAGSRVEARQVLSHSSYNHRLSMV
jgi:hypothetical protein